VKGNPLSFLLRLLLGTAAGFYYFLVSGAGGGGVGGLSTLWVCLCPT